MDGIKGQNGGGCGPRMAAVFAAGLSSASASGGYGWQGAALAIPVLFLMGWGTVRLSVCAPKRAAPLWAVLRLWGLALLLRRLGLCARRLENTGGGEPGTARWIVLLVAAFLLWTALRRGPVLLRAAPLCARLLLLAAGGVALWGASQMRWSYVLLPPADLWSGFRTALEAGAGTLFILPYIYKEGRGGENGRELLWVVLTAVSPALLAAVTAGVISSAVLPLAEEPFFAMTAALGRSVRAEGLVSCLWLVSDVMGLALLAQIGAGEKRWPSVFAICLAAAGAWLGILEGGFSWLWGAGTAILWCAAAVFLRLNRENCG